MSKDKQLNIYQKLLEVRKSVPYIQYNAKGYNFDYANESAVLGLLRNKLDEFGLFLEISMLSLDVIGAQKDTKYIKATKETLIVDVSITKVVVEFTWVNCDNIEEKIVKQMIMQRPGGDCQEIGAMLTYASRYFLLKYFTIPTSKDDPEQHNKKVQELQEVLEETMASNDQKKETISDEKWKVLDDYLNGDENLRKKLMVLCSTNDLRNISNKQLGICSEYSKRYKEKLKNEKNAA